MNDEEKTDKLMRELVKYLTETLDAFFNLNKSNNSISGVELFNVINSGVVTFMAKVIKTNFKYLEHIEDHKGMTAFFIELKNNLEKFLINTKNEFKISIGDTQ